MSNFLLGALCCWVMLSLFAMVCEALGWEDDDRFWFVLCLPVLIVAAPPLYVWYAFFYCPWILVVKPITQEHWDTADRHEKDRSFRITDRFYLYYRHKAIRWYHRLFFVRIRKEAHDA